VGKSSVADIAESRLCCSCGACAWACPEKAISYVETVGGYLLPKIDAAKCSKCGICTSICPGVGFVPTLANRLLRDPFIGTALRTYVGKATDRDLYINSQSGGIVSALLAHALENGEIEGAITAVMAAGNPPRTMARLAKSVEEIRQAQKSKYCPVPLLSILGEIEKLEQPVAFVGVGCQMHGLYNIFERFPHLKKKISFTIGLICDRTMTYGAIDFLLNKTDLPRKGGTMLHFRDKACGGYPGNVNVISSDDRSVNLPASARMRIKNFFTPACCLLCFDKMNVFADITVGDPWGIDEYDRIKGESVAVIRTEVGRGVFQSALESSALTVRDIAYDDVLVGQKIEQKRSQWQGYVDAWKNLGRPLPNFWEQVQKSSISQHQNGSYQRHLQHAFALDQYPSRDALIAATERYLFYRNMKRIATLPFRAMRRIVGKVKRIIIQGTGRCL